VDNNDLQGVYQKVRFDLMNIEQEIKTYNHKLKKLEYEKNNLKLFLDLIVEKQRQEKGQNNVH
jgi:5-methylcytosine-specific restriction endonuclease McrBC GTP-binding regulatory subunit McrB